MASQLSIDLPFSLPKSSYTYGKRSSGEIHGVVLTKEHVVNMILDITGYRQTEVLKDKTFLEPSCGHGAFLIPAINRFFLSLGEVQLEIDALKDRFRAYDIDEDHVNITRKKVRKVLVANNVHLKDAEALAETWVLCGDFLLQNKNRSFDFIIGNPPYIRIEQLSTTLQAEYRSRYASLFDRADIYVAFIEHGLDLLSQDGKLSFICADRWILNKYGAPLRKKITDKFGLQHYIDLHEASPFESNVVAYPAIFTIKKNQSEKVIVAALQNATVEECKAVTSSLIFPEEHNNSVDLHEYTSWFCGSEPWILSSPEHLDVLRDLENRYHPLEAYGDTKVGIGVATGNDAVYIVDSSLDVESDRLVPLVKREDIVEGKILDSNRSVINTFTPGKGTINLDEYPKLRAFFLKHEKQIKKRHVAQKNPGSWFRTIDRVYPELVNKPKLLIPDIAGSNEVAFDEGKYHPHHNLYYITSSDWDMEVLGGLLSSRVALFFIWSYSVKMRGKYLRFQAQYLRRICVPTPDTISKGLKKQIKDAFRKRDFQTLDVLSLKAYDIQSIPLFDFVDTRK